MPTYPGRYTGGMVPSPATIMRLRYFVRVGVRVAGASLVLWTLLNLMGLLTSTVWTFLNSRVDVASLAFSLLGAVGPAVVGGMLIFAAHKLARWLVPAPQHRCPECDYSLLGVTEGFCPECGLVLGEEVVEAGRRISAGPGRGG